MGQWRISKRKLARGELEKLTYTQLEQIRKKINKKDCKTRLSLKGMIEISKSDLQYLILEEKNRRIQNEL
jgi:hypothetical protein